MKLLYDYFEQLIFQDTGYYLPSKRLLAVLITTKYKVTKRRIFILH
jgi:hypothetical protein